MMLGVTSISTNLTGSLSGVGPTAALGEQAQFQRSLVQAASSIKNDAPSDKAGVASIPPTLEVRPEITQASPLGDRVLRTLSSIYHSDAGTSVPPSGEVTLVKGPLPGPAEQPLQVRPPEMQNSGAPPARNDFETMVAGLRNVYNDVTQVSLVCKSIGSVSSSVNKLVSAG
ncbi:nodulation protein [Mesorhizobium amorphae]|uniref:nodulation protein NolB n=1 Tax=Mesorhizobium amorphae TaxID=71433 RepID=UPI00235C9D36|nr:nodulation protein NolB [Mesorhizobium amorphae]GLR45952.1 nodulation protein [Mesorhizobium amorphae]